MPAFGLVSCGPYGAVVRGHSALGRWARRRVMTEVEKTGNAYPWCDSGQRSEGIRVLGLGSRCRSVQR
jgi:hypothetical protein